LRIVVNDIAASKGGALSVLKDFYNAVREYDKENEWIFLLGDNYLEETENIKIITLPHVKKSRFNKLLFDFFKGKNFINSLKPDIVFSLQNIITFGLKIPQIVYIHQSIPFQDKKSFSFFKRSERSLAIIQHFIGSIIKKSARKAQKIIVQTEWMKEAVANKAKTEKNKISVVMPNINVDLVDNQENYSFKRFFYPTSNAIYKNNDCIYKACELLQGSGVKDFQVEITVSSSPNELVKAIGYIDRKEVWKKYLSSVLVYPSYIESFSFPLAEARRFNSVILASDCNFSREVLRGYDNVHFFDPFKPEELAELMKKSISGEIIKQGKIMQSDNSDSWLEVINIIREKS